MKTTINCKEGFSEWVEFGLKFIGSGTYCREGNTFILNISPNHFELLSDMVLAWAKSYSDEFAKVNNKTRGPRPRGLYRICSEQ